jgi:hypothetical protein
MSRSLSSSGNFERDAIMDGSNWACRKLKKKITNSRIGAILREYISCVVKIKRF